MLIATFPQQIRPKKPLKRRRLNESAVDQTPSVSPLPHLASKALSCSSCYRAIATKSGYAICARCNATSCNVCSRTCTAIAPSQPPTPALTNSPTPPTTPQHRHALSPQSTNTNLAPPATKRRKLVEDNNLEEYSGMINVCDLLDTDGNIEMRFSTNHAGCNRVVCRGCCFEDIQSDTTTCYDCYGRDL